MLLMTSNLPLFLLAQQAATSERKTSMSLHKQQQVATATTERKLPNFVLPPFEPLLEYVDHLTCPGMSQYRCCFQQEHPGPNTRLLGPKTLSPSQTVS